MDEFLRYIYIYIYIESFWGPSCERADTKHMGFVCYADTHIPWKIDRQTNK